MIPEIRGAVGSCTTGGGSGTAAGRWRLVMRLVGVEGDKEICDVVVMLAMM